MEKGKVVLIDWGMVLHRSIFAWRKQKTLDIEYIALNQLFSYLRKIGLNKKDLVIIAVDSEKGSWRRDVIYEYKANRKAKRESFEDLDWKALFAIFDKLLELIDKSTPFHVIKIRKLEADDIIAYATKFYSDRECIIVSVDKDFELLWARDNVKLFSPLVKYKNRRGAYKICPSESYPYKLLSKKIEREASDNLVSAIQTKEDFQLRKMVVDIIHLPEFVELLVKKALMKIKNNKHYDYELIPFPSLRKKFLELFYDKKDRVEYDRCLEEFKKRRKNNGTKNRGKVKKNANAKNW